MAAQICETCKHQGKRCYCAPNSTCDAYEKRVITNFEKIKLMSVEEMADFFANDKYSKFPYSPCYICQYEQVFFCSKPNGCTDEYKRQIYQQWLEEEVK